MTFQAACQSQSCQLTGHDTGDRAVSGSGEQAPLSAPATAVLAPHHCPSIATASAWWSGMGWRMRGERSGPAPGPFASGLPHPASGFATLAAVDVMCWRPPSRGGGGGLPGWRIGMLHPTTLTACPQCKGERAVCAPVAVLGARRTRVRHHTSGMQARPPPAGGRGQDHIKYATRLQGPWPSWIPQQPPQSTSLVTGTEKLVPARQPPI